MQQIEGLSQSHRSLLRIGQHGREKLLISRSVADFALLNQLDQGSEMFGIQREVAQGLALFLAPGQNTVDDQIGRSFIILGVLHQIEVKRASIFFLHQNGGVVIRQLILGSQLSVQLPWQRWQSIFD